MRFCGFNHTQKIAHRKLQTYMPEQKMYYDARDIKKTGRENKMSTTVYVQD